MNQKNLFTIVQTNRHYFEIVVHLMSHGAIWLQTYWCYRHETGQTDCHKRYTTIFFTKNIFSSKRTSSGNSWKLSTPWHPRKCSDGIRVRNVGTNVYTRTDLFCFSITRRKMIYRRTTRTQHTPCGRKHVICSVRVLRVFVAARLRTLSVSAADRNATAAPRDLNADASYAFPGISKD